MLNRICPLFQKGLYYTQEVWERRSHASVPKFIQQAGGGLRAGSAGGSTSPFFSLLSLWPRAALSARPPLFVPTAERTAPMSPLERNEKKERIAAVTWALFHSPHSPWQRGTDPASTRPLFFFFFLPPPLDCVLKAERSSWKFVLAITDRKKTNSNVFCYYYHHVTIKMTLKVLDAVIFTTSSFTFTRSLNARSPKKY